MKQLFLLAFFAVICIFANATYGVDWPQWRGPDGQGHAAAKNVPTTWSEADNVAWKTNLPGRGHSSPVIGDGQVWMTTAIESPITEEEKKKKLEANTGSQPLTLVGSLSLRAICVDQKTGELLHNLELMTDDDPDWTHSINTFASPSPVLNDGKLYCSFGTHGTACLDTKTKKVVWTNRELKCMHENGPGSTPVVWGEFVILHFDGSDKQTIAGLDKKTGKVIWQTPRSGELNENPQLRKAYGTPLMMKIGERDILLSPAADWLYGYDPATGEEQWKLNYGVLGFSNVPRPVTGHGMIFLSTSFIKPQMLGVRVGENGEPEIAWKHDKGAPRISSPLLVGDELYFVSDNGVATCLDAKTGKFHWSKRLGGNFAASPLAVDGKVLFQNREGETFVIKPGADFELIATNKLDGGHWASPVAVGESLYLRTDKALYRIKKQG